MKKNNKTMILFLVILVLAFSPLFIIKTFNLNNKNEDSSRQKYFSLIEQITQLYKENRKMFFVIVEVGLISGLTGFFIGYFLTRLGKKKEVIEKEAVCPVCKEKFIKKVFKK